MPNAKFYLHRMITNHIVISNQTTLSNLSHRLNLLQVDVAVQLSTAFSMLSVT